MSLCFDEAYQALKSQEISEAQYLHEVLAHFCGIRHPADEKARPWELKVADPVGNAIREAALTSSAKPGSVFCLEKVFASTLQDDASAVRTLINELTEDFDDQPLPIQAIATFAALHNHAEVLRLCLKFGASLSDRNTSLALEFASRSPAILDILYEHDWRDMRSSKLAFDRMLEWSLHTGPQELTWFLDHGATVDKDTIRHAVRGSPVKTACVDLLLRRYGIELFRGTRLLQSAAKRGSNDIVRKLLDAGADVDELVPRPSHDDGDRLKTALYEAVYHQHENTVALLLAYGADPLKAVTEGSLGTPLGLAVVHDYANLVGMMQRSLGRRNCSPSLWASKL